MTFEEQNEEIVKPENPEEKTKEAVSVVKKEIEQSKESGVEPVDKEPTSEEVSS